VAFILHLRAFSTRAMTIGESFPQAKIGLCKEYTYLYTSRLKRAISKLKNRVLELLLSSTVCTRRLKTNGRDTKMETPHHRFCPARETQLSGIIQANDKSGIEEDPLGRRRRRSCAVRWTLPNSHIHIRLERECIVALLLAFFFSW
jgi:hypothetical protein